MILYFSGTGNSRYIAELLAEKTKDNILSLNQLIKHNKNEITSDKPWVFICPTYAWRPPKVVFDFIKNSAFIGSKKVYFLLTCGVNTLNSIHYIRKCCEEKKWELLGFLEFIMPDNYIVLSGGKYSNEKIKEQLVLAEEKINQFADTISFGNSLPVFRKNGGIIGKLVSGPINHLFYRFLIDGKGFYATSACVECKKCVAICPLNNIEMDSNKPYWNNNCTHCMACIGHCPTGAIEYKNRTQGKERYFLKERVR